MPPNRVHVLLLTTALAGAAAAAPPVITSISPRGAERGREVTLVIEGSGLHGAAELVSRMSSPAAPITDSEALKPGPAKVAFRITLSAAEAPGPHAIRVRTPEGISNPVFFTVGSLPETNEEEPNETAREAKPIPVPVTVNGRLGPTDRDAFRFQAKAGERIVFEVEARRIGSGVDPTLHVLRADGRELALEEDSYGLDVDARIDHTFADAGDYVVQVHDSIYAGRAPDFYRLKVGAFPYADAIFPLGGRAGTEVQVHLEGGNLAGPLTTWVRLDPDPLETWTRIALPLPAGGAAPFRFRIGSLPELQEAKREKPDAVQAIAAPVTLNGRIDVPGEVDAYSLDVAPGERWSFGVEAASLGSWLDAVVTVLAENGSRIAAADDEGSNLDSRGEFAVPEGAKKAIIRVEDLHARGGKPFAYRLTLARQVPDFVLRLGTTQVSLPLGGTGLIEIACERRGYGGPVRLDVPRAPVGFELRGGEILPDQDKGYITITGPASGSLRHAELVVEGSGGTAMDPIARRAQGTVFLAKEGDQPVSPLSIAAIACGVTGPPPLALRRAEEAIDVVPGHGVDVAIEAVRKDGVAGEITVKGIAAPAGIAVTETKVAADMSAGALRIMAAPEAALREGDLVAAGFTKVGGADFMAPLPALRVRVVPPFAAELTVNTAEAPAGSNAVFEGKIRRRAPFGGKVDGKVDGLPEAMKVSAFEVAPEKDTFRLEVAIPREQAPGKLALGLQLSTALGDPKKPVVHALPALALALTIRPPAPDPTPAPATPAGGAAPEKPKA